MSDYSEPESHVSYKVKVVVHLKHYATKKRIKWCLRY